jgi:hypothetical protein
MASVFLPEHLSLDERRFLEGPLVVHASAWNDSRPEWIAQQVGAERVGIVFGQTPLYIIGPAELTAVMYGASLDAPMGHYHADLYIWASLQATAVWKRRDPVDWARELGLELMPDDQVLQPGGRLHHIYSELAHDVRRRVIAQQAERERIANREARAQQTANKPRPVISEQMKLFDGEPDNT